MKMKPTIIIVFIFFPLIAYTKGLRCYECVSIKSGNYSTPPCTTIVDCSPNEKKCASSSGDTMVDGKKVEVIATKCVQNDNAENSCIILQTFVPRVNDYVDYNVCFCDTNLCNNETNNRKNEDDNNQSGNDDSKVHSKNDNGLIIGIVIGIAALLIILITAVAWKTISDKNQTIRKLSEKEVKEFIYGKKNSENAEDHNIVNYEGIAYNDKYEINPNILMTNDKMILGSGAFGVVTLAELAMPNENKIKVAVKSTKKDADVEYIRSILIEIKIFQYLGQHDYIIGFIGAVTKDIRDGTVSVVMEFCELGSLLEYLKMNNSCITNTQMTQWAFEIACGMEHLETKKVVHADLATRNILVTSQISLKITDFGLSRKLYNYDIYSKKNKVTLWEIFSGGKTPFVGHNWSSDFVNLIENGLRLSRPKHASEEIYNLMKQCWMNLPEDRPKFADIIKDALLISKKSNLYTDEFCI